MTVAWAVGCVSAAREHPREGDSVLKCVCVCLCETERVAMRPAAVTSTRSSVKKRRGWTGCLSNTLLPFSLDKRTTQGTKLHIRTEC